MGDLQCPARFFLAGPGNGAGLAARLRAERLGAVCASDVGAAEATAREVIDAGGTGVVRMEEAPPGDRSRPRSTVLRGWLESLADRYRGEALLVVGEPETLEAALAGLVTGWSRGDTLTEVLVVEADADGWRLVSRLSIPASGQ